ncbi:MAG: hypothetical protein EZS28_005285 [Streblomastix strix]|uniref:Uncharacterized protein n=1 Tax=Streblomastix strix TaxID=222440 RepID=A0A5J4WVY7_9EUKA|nr:MAG: hypothetical protein EZS28_005285 [Streblomastix strix]
MKLECYYAGAVTDECIDTKEVQGATLLFGIQLSVLEAQQLLRQIAGVRQSMTQQSFVETIIGFVQSRHQQKIQSIPPYMKPSVALLQIPPYAEPSYASPSYQQGYSGSQTLPHIVQNPYYNKYINSYPQISPHPQIQQSSSLPHLPQSQQPPIANQYQQSPIGGYLQQSSVYQPPVGYQPPIGYQQEMDQYVSQPDTVIAQRIATFYTQTASQGMINSNAVIDICAQNGVACTSDVARQILSTAAGPEQKVTQDKFVHHVGLYMSKNIKR